MKTYFPFNEQKARALTKVLFSFRENRWCDFKKVLSVAYSIEREFMKEHGCFLIGGRHICSFEGIYNVDFFKKIISDKNFIEFFKEEPSAFSVFNMAKLKDFGEVSFDNFSDFERDIICKNEYKDMIKNLDDLDIRAIHFKYEEWLGGKIGQDICVLEVVNPDFKEKAVAYINDFEAFSLYNKNS